MRSYRSRTSVLSVLSWAVGSALAFPADGAGAASAPQSSPDDILTLLKQETELATRSKMNADYVPGILTVLHGEDLEALGARTLWDALGLVPGFESTLNNFGNPLAVVRGIGFDTLTSHLKLFVDSVPVNLSFTGANHAVMRMPAAQIERVEVIRGPGTALHGEFAFAGVINVITVQERRRVYVGAGRFDSFEVGGRYFLERPERKLRLGAAFSFADTDGADMMLLEDALKRQQPAVALTPGPANEDERQRVALVSLEYRGLEARVQDVRRSNGFYFGTRSRQPDPDARDQTEGYIALDLRYRFRLRRTLEAQARAAALYGNRTFKEWLLPPGATNRFAAPTGQPPNPVVTLPLGLPFLSYHGERRFDGGLDLTWSPSERHSLLLRASHGDIEITDTRQESTVAVLTGRLLDSYRVLGPGESGAAPPGSGRTITSFGAQHQWKASERLTTTFGGRYDEFSDVSSRFHPRVAAVLRLGEPHIVKAQYAEAFRPPSLQALNLPSFTSVLQRGNPDIRPETIRVFELGYVYRKPSFVGRASAYRSDADDLIGSVAGRSENITDFHYVGAELELEWRFRSGWRALANGSWFDATDEKDVRGQDSFAERLYNIALLGRLRKELHVSAWLRGIGERGRRIGDTRPPLDGYACLDLGLTLSQIAPLKGLQLRGGVKNLLDADIRAPATPNSFLDDLPRPGRTFWVQAAWQF